MQQHRAAAYSHSFASIAILQLRSRLLPETPKTYYIMEPLKNMFSPALLQPVAAIAATTISGFDADAFLPSVFDAGWEALELKQRMRHISTMLHAHLSGHYEQDILQVLALTEAIMARTGKQNTFEYMFLPDYLEQYGTEHVALSLKAMETITVLSSCEYAIRPLLLQNQDATLPTMLGWTNHTHASVRRLASEGCRPRLPWGSALPRLKKDPAPIIPILEALKNDPSEFVRKSVANSLNDIAKDNPGIALKLASQWMGANKNTDWIVKHGCRTLLKKADAGTLQLFGLSGVPQCAVTDLKLAAHQVEKGQHLHFSFTLNNTGTAPEPLRVEYAITYAKANQKTSRKVFKITENTYQPGRPVAFARKQSMADMTTRKHYAGLHTLAICINGNEQARLDFELTEP